MEIFETLQNVCTHKICGYVPDIVNAQLKICIQILHLLTILSMSHLTH